MRELDDLSLDEAARLLGALETYLTAYHAAIGPMERAVHFGNGANADADDDGTLVAAALFRHYDRQATEALVELKDVIAELDVALPEGFFGEEIASDQTAVAP